MTTIITLGKYKREFNCKFFSLFYFSFQLIPFSFYLYFFEKGVIEKFFFSRRTKSLPGLLWKIEI